MIASIYSHPDNQPPKSKLWYKISGKEEDGELIEAAGRVEYRDHVKNRHVLIIRNLKKNDSAEYRFSLQRGGKQKKADLPGVTLVVTGTSSDYSYIFNKMTCCMFSTFTVQHRCQVSENGGLCARLYLGLRGVSSLVA